MAVTRRQILAGLTGLAACEGAPDPSRPIGTPPSCSATVPVPEGSDVWRPPGDLDEAAFPGGLRAVDPGVDSLLLSARTLEPEATLVGVAAIDGRWEPLDEVAAVAVDGVLHVEIGGLRPDTDHAFVLLGADGERRSDIGRFRTAPTGARVVRIGASCCFGKTNLQLPSLAVAAADGLDAFVLAGDAIYTKATTLDGYRAAWDGLLAREHFRALASSTPLVAIWDDHEVANDWMLGPPAPGQVEVTAERVALARAAFDEVLPLRTDTLWRSVRFGATLEVLVLDARGERTVDAIVSEAQLAWAVEALVASPCRFKLVITGVHVTDHADRLSFPRDDSDVYGRWQGFPAQRDVLVAAAEAVPGVVFVTGDMHYGGLQRVGPAGGPGAALWEVAAGPGGSEPWDVAGWLADRGADDSQYDVLLDGWSYARFTADPDAGLTVELVGDDGTVLAERVLIA